MPKTFHLTISARARQRLLLLGLTLSAGSLLTAKLLWPYLSQRVLLLRTSVSTLEGVHAQIPLLAPAPLLNQAGGSGSTTSSVLAQLAQPVTAPAGDVRSGVTNTSAQNTTQSNSSSLNTPVRPEINLHREGGAAVIYDHLVKYGYNSIPMPKVTYDLVLKSRENCFLAFGGCKSYRSTGSMTFGSERLYGLMATEVTAYGEAKEPTARMSDTTSYFGLPVTYLEGTPGEKVISSSPLFQMSSYKTQCQRAMNKLHTIKDFLCQPGEFLAGEDGKCPFDQAIPGTTWKSVDFLTHIESVGYAEQTCQRLFGQPSVSSSVSGSSDPTVEEIKTTLLKISPDLVCYTPVFIVVTTEPEGDRSAWTDLCETLSADDTKCHRAQIDYAELSFPCTATNVLRGFPTPYTDSISGLTNTRMRFNYKDEQDAMQLDAKKILLQKAEPQKLALQSGQTKSLLSPVLFGQNPQCREWSVLNIWKFRDCADDSMLFALLWFLSNTQNVPAEEETIHHIGRFSNTDRQETALEIGTHTRPQNVGGLVKRTEAKVRLSFDTDIDPNTPLAETKLHTRVYLLAPINGVGAIPGKKGEAGSVTGQFLEMLKMSITQKQQEKLSTTSRYPQGLDLGGLDHLDAPQVSRPIYKTVDGKQVQDGEVGVKGTGKRNGSPKTENANVASASRLLVEATRPLQYQLKIDETTIVGPPAEDNLNINPTEQFYQGLGGRGPGLAKPAQGTSSTAASAAALKPVAVCQPGSPRITSGEGAKHRPTTERRLEGQPEERALAGRSCNMYVQADHLISNWQNPEDPVRDCNSNVRGESTFYSYIACTYPKTLIQNKVNDQGVHDVNGGQTACAYIVNRARQAGISPRFALAMMGEESGFGEGNREFGVTVLDAGQQDHAIGLQMDRFINTVKGFPATAEGYRDFLRRYSGEVRDTGVNKDIFCNNKDFPGRLKEYYDYLGP